MELIHYLVTRLEISRGDTRLTMAIRKQGHAMSQEAGSQGKRQFGKGVKSRELTGYVDFLKELRKVGMSKLGFQSNGPPTMLERVKLEVSRAGNFLKRKLGAYLIAA